MANAIVKVMIIGVLFIIGTKAAPYNCSVMNGRNVTWMQMLDDDTVLGGYSYYFTNGTYDMNISVNSSAVIIFDHLQFAQLRFGE